MQKDAMLAGLSESHAREMDRHEPCIRDPIMIPEMAKRWKKLRKSHGPRKRDGWLQNLSALASYLENSGDWIRTSDTRLMKPLL